MVRKIAAVVVSTMTALLLLSAPALAATPELNPPEINQVVTTPQIQVSGTNQIIGVVKSPVVKQTVVKQTAAIEVLPASGGIGNLPNTGVSFNVPLTLGIGAIVVLAGFALVFFGGRGAMRGRRTH